MDPPPIKIEADGLPEYFVSIVIDSRIYTKKAVLSNTKNKQGKYLYIYLGFF